MPDSPAPPAVPFVGHFDAEHCRQLFENESHFLDFKALEVGRAKVTKARAAFANADGGGLYIGIDETINRELEFVNRRTARTGRQLTVAALNSALQRSLPFITGSFLEVQFLRFADPSAVIS